MDTDTGDASKVKEVVEETIEEDGKTKEKTEGATMASSEDDALLEGAGEEVDGKRAFSLVSCPFFSLIIDVIQGRWLVERGACAMLFTTRNTSSLRKYKPRSSVAYRFLPLSRF